MAEAIQASLVIMALIVALTMSVVGVLSAIDDFLDFIGGDDEND